MLHQPKLQSHKHKIPIKQLINRLKLPSKLIHNVPS
uniref:Uncharacterized protein n=1 Tax=Rhizophora mucronata TaxID=61149 RepID=A0A2P2J7W4_RHIMU